MIYSTPYYLDRLLLEQAKHHTVLNNYPAVN